MTDWIAYLEADPKQEPFLSIAAAWKADKARLADAEEELSQWRATMESVTRNEHDLAARLAEESCRHMEQTAELVQLAEQRRVRLAEAEALLQETCERISEAETTSSVLTGQLPEYSEGQQMLSRLATVMGDLMKRIRAFRAADRSEDAGK